MQSALSQELFSDTEDEEENDPVKDSPSADASGSSTNANDIAGNPPSNEMSQGGSICMIHNVKDQAQIHYPTVSQVMRQLPPTQKDDQQKMASLQQRLVQTKLELLLSKVKKERLAKGSNTLLHCHLL